MEVSIRFNQTFLIVKNVRNEPGVGAEIMGDLYELGVDTEYFHATPSPDGKKSDILIMINNENLEKTVFGINTARKKTGGDKTVILTDLTGIIIRGSGTKEISQALTKAFSICTKHEVNVALVYTTFVSANLYVSSETVTKEFMDDLRKGFE
ncbi:MAG: hypothetical protein PHE49_07120 [bacterium]|nr:hypothetical protein [bacterium]